MNENTPHIYYILKKEYNNFGYEEIINHRGNILAKVKFPLHNINFMAIIQDLDEKITIFIENKKALLYKIYAIKDSNNNSLAKIKINKASFLKQKASLKSMKSQNTYLAYGNLRRWSYKIINTTNNEIIGTVSELKNSKLEIFNDNESHHYYCLKIQRFEEFPIIFLGFVICINNLGFDRVSNIAGLERRIARLRPFGPRKMN